MLFSFLRSNLFYRNRVTRICLALSALLLIALLLSLYLEITPRVEAIALRYNIYFGLDLIAPWWAIFFLPLTGFLVCLLNFCLAHALFLKSQILSYFLMFSAVAFQAVLAVLVLLIILLNR